MKNSSVLAAFINQFPDTDPKDITVEFLAAEGNTHEFLVKIFDPDIEKFIEYIFKCSSTYLYVEAET